MTKTMYDAAFPPQPPNVDAVAGYIGGNTPHVWTDAEWAASGKRWRLPIFTRSHDGDPRADALFSVNWLRGHAVPVGATLALDYETRVDAAYLRTFDGIIANEGYRTMVYGSLSTIMQNPKPSGGYWTAHWTNTPHLCTGAIATQYGGDVTLGKPYDLNVISDSLPLWDMLGENMPVLDQTDLDAIASRLGLRSGKRVADNGDVLTVINGDSTHLDSLKSVHIDLNAGLTALTTLVQAGGTDPVAIAQVVVDAVGPALAAVVATELQNLTLKAVPA